MSTQAENAGINVNSLKYKAIRTIRDLFYPTLELRILSICLVFLSLCIQPSTADDVFYQFAPGAVAILCIILSTWLEMSAHYTQSLQLRTGASMGLHYGMMLVPLVLTALIQSASHDSMTAVNKKYIAYLQFYLLAMSVFAFIVLLYTIIQRFAKPPNDITLVIIACFAFTLLVYNIFPIKEGFLSMLSLLVLCTVTLVVLIDTFPRSFTGGEAIILAESIGLLLFDSIFMVLNRLNIMNPPSFMDFTKSPVSTCVQIFLAFTLVFILTLSPVWFALRHGASSPVLRLSPVLLLLFSIGLVGAPVLGSFLGMNPVSWFLEKFLFAKPHRPALVAYMGAVTTISILFGIVLVKYIRMDSNTKRKVFHIFAVLIYTPALLYDIESIALASSVAVCCLLLLELYHNLRMGPYSAEIHTFMQELSGVRTSPLSGVYLNHIYLLLGLSLSSWLLPVQRGARIFVYAGVLSLGVLDAFAGIFGKLMGRRKWFKNGKSVEGFIIGFLATASAIFLITSLDYYILPFSLQTRPHRLIRTLISSFLTSLIEAVTTQHDNLILAPFYFSLLTVIDRKDFFYWF